MICVLNVVRGPSTRSRYVLRGRQHVEIGRSSKADISLPSDAHLSRRHLAVDADTDGFSICDLGSANGTFLNEKRVARALLKHGDLIRIGMTHLRVSMMDDNANPHAEDGVDFSSSSTVEPRQRSICFTNVIPGEEKSVAEAGVPDSRLAAASPPAVSDFVSPGKEPNLYDLIQPMGGPWGDYVSLLTMLSGEKRVIVIFNTSQLSSQQVADLEKGLSHRIALSQTLVAGELHLTDAVLPLLMSCTRCDALMCLGASQRIEVEKLLPFANSLSFPSMFGEHIKEADAPIRRFLQKRHAWLLFEWSSSGPLGLFAPTGFFV